MTDATNQAALLSPPAHIAAEVEIDEGRVRRLLRAQHPDLAREGVTHFAEGWDNTLYRVGESWLARLPRRACAAPLVAMELRWLRQLAPHLPLPVPVPAREGRPGEGYPFRWSLSRWIDGQPAAAADLDPSASAEVMGGFLRALHGLTPHRDGPISGHRGVPPRMRSEALFSRIDEIRKEVDVGRIERGWRSATAAPDWTGPPVWCHGDLHPFNLLAREGRPSAVLDWGDLHVGEPAPDLASAWMLLPASEHRRFLDAYGAIDEATWQRARAWALYLGVMFVIAGADGSGAAATRLGHVTLERVLA